MLAVRSPSSTIGCLGAVAVLIRKGPLGWSYMANLFTVAKPLLFTALLLVPETLVAQSSAVQLAPYTGAYSPLTDLERSVVVDDERRVFRLDPQPGLAVGARAIVWLVGPLGVEGTVAYALHDVRRSFEADTTSRSAHAWLGSGRAVLGFGAQGAPIAFHLAGGLSFVARGGDAYRGARDKENLGGVVGVGADFDLGGKLGLTVDVENYFYELRVRVRDPVLGDLQLTHQFQSDLVLTAGLSITLGG